MAEIQMRGLAKRYGRHPVIEGLDLTIRDREFVVVVGPSGCGKSTLLRLIAGLEEITAGDLMFDGERVNALAPQARGVAMVFQSYALYPHMTAYQNMAFGLSLARTGRAEIDRRVREAAAMLELTPLLDRLPKALSGGQRQRVAIGRAIVRQPRVFLFDEPLSNLDAALRGQMRAEIARLHARFDTTMVYVTHDQTEAMTLADRIVLLNAGRIEQHGTPLELYHRPANRFVAGFLGAPPMNFLPVAAGGGTIALPGGGAMALDGQTAGATTLGIRPEDLTLAPEGPIRGAVELVEELGENHLLHLRLDGQALVAKLPGAAANAPGDTVALAIPPDRCHLFAPDGRRLD
ncbi:MAG: sn-glycerol-3-phosphate ABC transporter ATP-binding protein UgpC [Pseudomonadota bacterium]